MGLHANSPDRRSRRWRPISIFALGASLIAGSMLTAVGLAGPAAASEFVPSGDPVVLSTGGTNAVTFGDLEQTLGTKGKCELTTSGASILDISARIETTATAGFLNGSLGVAEKAGGTSCYEVNSATPKSGAETLVIKLNPSGGVPLAAQSALLDLELKGSAEISVTAKRGGNEVDGFTLGSGDESCTSDGADSGPDAREGDNCYFEVDPSEPFDTLEMTAESGAFSVEGGSDWGDPSAHRTIFNVGTYYDRVSSTCNTTITQTTGADTLPQVEIYRLSDADGACGELPYSFAQGAGSFTFLKPGSTEDAQFVIRVTWVKPVADGFKRTTVDFSNGTDPDAVADLPWCDADVYGANDAVVGLAPDQDSALRGTQYACLDTSNWKVTAKGTKLKVTEVIYLLGDVIFRG
jgi:hypothetical protein